MTANEIKREQPSFEVRAESLKKRTKEFFSTYENPNGSEDRLEICLIREGYRAVLMAEEEINRQKAEIERLQRLLAEADITYNKCAKRFYKEGVEDFAKRLKDRPRKHLLLRPDSYYKQYVRVTDIDSLKKEMAGEG